MKTTKIMAMLLLGVSFLWMGACQPSQKKQDDSEPSMAEKPEPVKAPEQIISLEESKSLYDNYSRNRVEVIQQFEREQNNDEKFEVARFTAFDYATIKQYIAFIEQEADSAGVDISSLRFYFANYPNTEKFPDGKRVVHPRQNSIFIVPTIDVDGQDFGFYISADGEAKLIKDAVGAKGMGSTEDGVQKSYAGFAPNFSAAFQSGDQSLNLNRGSSSPPPPGDF